MSHGAAGAAVGAPVPRPEPSAERRPGHKGAPGPAARPGRQAWPPTWRQRPARGLQPLQLPPPLAVRHARCLEARPLVRDEARRHLLVGLRQGSCVCCYGAEVKSAGRKGRATELAEDRPAARPLQVLAHPSLPSLPALSATCPPPRPLAPPPPLLPHTFPSRIAAPAAPLDRTTPQLTGPVPLPGHAALPPLYPLPRASPLLVPESAPPVVEPSAPDPVQTPRTASK